MACLEICTYPDPVLKQEAAHIEKVDSELFRLIDDMAETMYEAPGIGLAANQVGKPLQLVVIDLQRPEYEHGLIVLINPEIIEARGETTYEEGCLSVPEYFARVKRAEEVTVCGLDPHGKSVRIEASGLLAVVLQHEIDHLAGKLFVDRLGPIARDVFRRKWKKKLKEDTP
ncbi:peptide deformylase [Desulfoferrobacter suflitae]|uniref:peptide deformylase n=1 Tax=Desulfoferrobacter suflitae TaxID=2865782 RepID=UPI0021645FD8|nr:peptide deformylase [Desulfoferrobacter suflitae]MCK8600196.1 peptide deformylase [Desulfoferrobacter suflitae]